MTRQAHSPYTSRYKKSVMGSPQPPRNPFRRTPRNAMGRSSGILPSRYAFQAESHFLAKAFKQACVILVAGTILVSLLSVAIPPAPLTSRMAAPRPQQHVVENGAANFRATAAAANTVRKRGGVRSQSTIRTNVKKPKTSRQSSALHWDAETLEHDGDGEHPNFVTEGTSSDESLSKQHAAKQLAAEIESEAIKENAAADGVFGRTKDGEEVVKTKSDDKKKPKTAPINVDSIDVNDDRENESKKEKSLAEKDIVSKSKGEDAKATTGQDDALSGANLDETKKAEEKLGKSAAKLAALKLEDKSVDDTSERDEEMEKNGAFGKEEVANGKTASLKDHVHETGVAANESKANANASNGDGDVNKTDSKSDKSDSKVSVRDRNGNSNATNKAKVALASKKAATSSNKEQRDEASQTGGDSTANEGEADLKGALDKEMLDTKRIAKQTGARTSI